MTCHRHTAIRSNSRISQRERLNLGRSSIGENGGERERERADLTLADAGGGVTAGGAGALL